MSIRVEINGGADDYGKFAIYVPGWCDPCKRPVDVSLKYNVGSLHAALKRRGHPPVVPKTRDSLLVTKHLSLGVTCGCYAKAQRQLAYARPRRATR